MSIALSLVGYYVVRLVGNEQGIQVFAVEPTAAPTMAMSLAAGAPQTMDDFARTYAQRKDNFARPPAHKLHVCVHVCSVFVYVCVKRWKPGSCVDIHMLPWYSTA